MTTHDTTSFEDSEIATESSLLNNILVDSGDIFRYTNDVYMELSNLCNYADIHKKCPVNMMQKNKNILPSRMVYEICDTLHQYNFAGRIAFHTYNEPLMDPRLFMFIAHARKSCPQSTIFICTNGYYLNQELADELVSVGTSAFYISAYSESEEARLNTIKVPVEYTVKRTTLDTRLSLYDTPEKDTDKPCYSPLSQILVTAQGRISLCCLDWQRCHTFGNLHDQSFEDAMKNHEMWLTYERLARGERFLNMCKRCGWSRGNVPDAVYKEAATSKHACMNDLPGDEQ